MTTTHESGGAFRWDELLFAVATGGLFFVLDCVMPRVWKKIELHHRLNRSGGSWDLKRDVRGSGPQELSIPVDRLQKSELKTRGRSRSLAR